MRKFLTMCLGLAMLAMAVPAQVFAQSGKYEVKGVVVDTTGTPIIGASVVEQGTTNGVTTDVNGQYRLMVNSAESVVVVSFIGYETQTLVASSTLLQNLVLPEDSEMIDDVVVIGYGTVKKTDLTGSISTVKADQTNKGLATSPTDLLRGKSAGVVVTTGDGAPGSGADIRIRGGASLSASNAPMIVIDGLPVSNDDVSGMGNPLTTINPSDIESFTVLKDASATAIFGSRASNGVIIITTKKGSRYDSAVPHVSADFTASLSQNAKYVDVLTGDEMRQLMEWYVGGDKENAAYKALGTANTDWQREIYQLAQSYEANVSLTGNVKMGDKNRMPYRVSGGYVNQDGTLKTSNMERGTLALNLNPILLDDHLNINLNAKGNITNSRFANTDAVGEAVRFDPTKPVYDENGLNGYYWWGANSNATSNPVASLMDKVNVSNAKRFIGNAQVDYKIHGLEDLRLNLNVGMDWAKSGGTVDVASGREMVSKDGDPRGDHKDYRYLRRDRTLEFYADYSKTLGDHSFGVMAGYSWQHFWNKSKEHQYRLDTERSAEDYWIKKPITNMSEYFLVSFFGRVNYSYANRYMITATFRADGTSRFQNNKWGFFPSVALAWNAKNESFLEDVDEVSALKLRLSYGQTGQQAVGELYGTIPTYVNNQQGSFYPFGDKWIEPITPQGYNADLKWETTTTYNVGVDLGFLDNRITASADFYHRYTTDLLNWTPVAAGSNLTNYLDANIGEMKNIGVEAEINAVAIQTKDWFWTIGANVAWNKNTIVKMTSDDEREEYQGVPTGGISGGIDSKVQIHQSGHPMSSFFVYQQVYDANGKPIEGMYVDRNKDGKIDQYDKYCFHDPAPKVTLGFNTQLSWKDLTLAVSAHANFGNWIYNNVASNGELLTDLWTNNFVANRVSSATHSLFSESAQYFSDYYVTNASFFKLDNITLSYRFHLGKPCDRDMSLNVFATVQNVATITGYKGIDPEIAGGIDNNMYPRPRTYILGVKFNF